MTLIYHRLFAEISEIQVESASIGEVIALLETTEDIPIEFDPTLWRVVVEKVLVESDDTVRFILVGGEEYTFEIY